MCAPAGVSAPPGLPTAVPLAVSATAATPETLTNTTNTVHSVPTVLTLLTFCTLSDMGKLDPDDPRPPYQQIADQLRDAIESGDLAPGDQLPALPVVTSEYGVSLGTARSALGVLREAGLIVTRHGKGSYVRTRTLPEQEGTDTALKALSQTVEQLAERLDAVERRLADR
jgi:DNA-binding transcriptional regulator YhcF (GntR family)